MFRGRVSYEEWAALLAALSLLLVGGAFLYLVVRALLMKREAVDERARLALYDGPPGKSNAPGQTPATPTTTTAPTASSPSAQP